MSGMLKIKCDHDGAGPYLNPEVKTFYCAIPEQTFSSDDLGRISRSPPRPRHTRVLACMDLLSIMVAKQCSKNWTWISFRRANPRVTLAVTLAVIRKSTVSYSDGEDESEDDEAFDDEGQLPPEHYLAQAKGFDVSQL
ncbi:hypothetical protein FE257_005655 [Aspergillus nanangensis]|uniref:Uncharacterized protein n=1 Tax=Aspergillus nanangensis TaxID=2582783 RepID=A0AAD4GMT1_ASPNN|nr:hypothetical protein FE257_005655 [Aspergillus nanangensis]